MPTNSIRLRTVIHAPMTPDTTQANPKKEFGSVTHPLM
jgi:hypothetical protein